MRGGGARRLQIMQETCFDDRCYRQKPAGRHRKINTPVEVTQKQSNAIGALYKKTVFIVFPVFIASAALIGTANRSGYTECWCKNLPQVMQGNLMASEGGRRHPAP